MTNLTDAQRILLSSASQRNNGSLLPLPASVAPGSGASKALAVLVKRDLAAERETDEQTAVHRSDGDLRYGLFITPTGLTAIGVEVPGNGDTADAADAVDAALQAVDAAAAPPRAGKPGSKTAAVLALLARPHGATMAELVVATGWLPHTTRAALTGLRKKGHDITRGKADGLTCYRIAEAG